MCSNLKSFLLLITVISLNSGPSNGQQHMKKSLVIVLDVTASMRDNIEMLRHNCIKLLDNVHSWAGFSIENYILVQFDDEEINQDIIEPFVDTNYKNLKDRLNEVKINQRNIDANCTASCYRGLKRGLELANEDSIFLVFTDGGTKHKELKPEIKELTEQKRISFYFTLVKGCAWTTPDADDYYELVSVYNGDVYNVNGSTIKTHFDLLAQIVSGPPLAPNVEVIVDSTMSEFTLTVTGLNAIITIFDPKQKYVSSTLYEVLTNSRNVKMIRVPDPLPGRYTIEIVSETRYTGQVQTKSDLQFKYGFAVHEPSSMRQTGYAPLYGHNTYLAISPSNTTLIENLEKVILITTSHREHQYKLQKKPAQGGNLFLTEPFPVPSEPFKIQVEGWDRKKNRILRLISPVLTGTSLDFPSVYVDGKISVQEGDPIYLICRVYSMVNVTIRWSKLGLNSPLKVLKFRQSDTLNYTIDYSRVLDSGEYACTAKNSMGKAESKSIVTVQQTRLVVRTPLQSINTEIGTQMIVLKCDVSPNTKYVKVSWLFNGKPAIPQGAQYNQSNLILFNIERNFNGLYTCVGLKGAEQMYADIQLNVMYPPTIMQLINSNTNTTIDATGSLKMFNNSRLQIFCDYESFPKSTVEWISPTGDVITNTSALNLDNVTQSGDYSCQVENQLGKAEQKIEIIISLQAHEFEQTTPITFSTDASITKSFGPSIVEIQLIDDMGDYRTLEPNEQEIEIVDRSNITVICKTEGIPMPSTQWKNNEIILSTINKLTISALNLNVSGVYECITENHINISRRAITIKQIIKPTMIQNYSNTVELIEGTSFTMRCPIEIGDYNVTWILNGENIDNFKLSDGSLYMGSVNVNMKGVVLCVGSNKAGSVNATFMFDILRPPYDLLGSSLTDKIPILNAPYDIECSAKGWPEPKLYWTKDDGYFRRGNFIHFDKFQSGDIGKYICIAVNNLGIANKTFILDGSDPLLLTNSAPYNIQAETSTGRQPILGQPYEIKCTSLGNPKPVISWVKDGTIIERGNSVWFPQFQQQHSGDYMCIAQNYMGEATKIFTLLGSNSSETSSSTHFIRITAPNNVDKLCPTMLILVPVCDKCFEANWMNSNVFIVECSSRFASTKTVLIRTRALYLWKSTEELYHH